MWRNFLMMSVIFCLSLGIFYVTIFQLDPLGEQRLWAMICLYTSVLFMVWSFLSFVLFFGSEILVGHKLGNRSFVVALRRAFFVGCFVVCCVALQYYRLLNPLHMFILFIFYALLEWVFMTTKVESL